MSNFLSTVLNILSYSTPLLLAATGALFSEYAGRLALFLEGIISLAAFSYFTLSVSTGSVVMGFIFTLILCTALETVFAYIFEKTKANVFIAAIGLNLFFAALPSFLSSIFFNTRGVLTAPVFQFNSIFVKHFTVAIGFVLIAMAILFLTKTKQGLYILITGSDAEVLNARGISVEKCKIKSWAICGFLGSVAGCLLCMRISSFVPNISSGRGWMALAAVFLGNKKPMRMAIMTLIFCAADYFSANIQNLFPAIPSALLLSLPYIVAIVLIIVPKPSDRQ